MRINQHLFFTVMLAALGSGRIWPRFSVLLDKCKWATVHVKVKLEANLWCRIRNGLWYPTSQIKGAKQGRKENEGARREKRGGSEWQPAMVSMETLQSPWEPGSPRHVLVQQEDSSVRGQATQASCGAGNWSHLINCYIAVQYWQLLLNVKDNHGHGEFTVVSS